MSAFVSGIMESLICPTWLTQIKERVRDACVSETEGACKTMSFGEAGAGGDTQEEKRAKTVGNLLISTNYLSRKCWKLERICVSK